MQHEILAPQRLLNEKGNIAEPGFARKLYWQYDRKDIRAPKWRIKEWDYYYIGCQDYGLALTISDAGYVSSLSVSLLEYGAAEAVERRGDGHASAGKTEASRDKCRGRHFREGGEGGYDLPERREAARAEGDF